MSRRIAPLLLGCAALLVFLLPATTAQSAARPAPETAVVLETAAGRIVLQLADREAPRTCANFRKLVAQGFYDSLYFHRVVAGFVIQGGDPNCRDADPFNDGEGGPGWTVPAEIGLPHVRGAVAMARLPDAVNRERASNGSQFFICVADRADLDRGGYTVFARVISGLDAVDRIVQMGSIPGITRTQAGPNPERLALIRRARLEPLARWSKPQGTKVSGKP